MAIDPFITASYAPWGNAALAFVLPTNGATTASATGNYVPVTEVIEYLAALNIDPPNWSGKPGADETVYVCRGRLLSPSTLDPRITNGSQAAATVNGVRGRFELVFDLAPDIYHVNTLRQTIQGTFRMRGGA
jgi:hypothetical protein